jgi:large subunit ribosomal protein L6
MSRIGKQPVKIPQGVKVNVEKGVMNVEGPKGTLSQDFLPVISVKVEDSNVVVSRKNESKRCKSLHGLYRNLLNNMVLGVSQGFTKVLLINGVGYRAEVQGKILILNLGYSNPVEFPIPDDLTITCESQNRIVVSGIDKQKVGHTAAQIRSIRPPEPYKGKGVRYENEQVRRKVGKAGVK